MTTSVDVVILAGGLGTRLQSVVSDRPKVLAEVKGRPFLDYLLQQLEKFRQVKKVILALGYQAEKVMAQYQKYSSQTFTIDFSTETQPLGTGGAIRRALLKTESRDVLIMNGDSYVHFDLTALQQEHEKKGGVLTNILFKTDDRRRFGTVTLDSQTNRIKEFQEKSPSELVDHESAFINAGVYLIQKQVFEKWPVDQNVSMEKEILPTLIPAGIYGHVSQGPFIDIGIPESYREAENFSW